MTLHGVPSPRLLGERVVLEPLAIRHAVEMVDVLSCPSLYVLIGGRPPSLLELTARYQRQTADLVTEHELWLNWIVCSQGQAVGFVQATLRQGEEGVLSAAVAWLVRLECQGRGLATEAAEVMVDHLRAQRGAAITAWISDANLASVSVATRLSLHRTPHRADGEQLWTDLCS